MVISPAFEKQDVDGDASVCGDTDGQKRGGKVQTESEVKPRRMCNAVCKADSNNR